ncbi:MULTISPECIES: BBE domain-containing protein [unclassified Spirillospora]
MTINSCDYNVDSTPVDATRGNHRRLREIKRAYDPQNVFHRNHNIKPA